MATIFSENAQNFDANDIFVGDNIQMLKDAGLSYAGVPKEFGGAGANISDLCGMLRIIGAACGSTGLAFSMHTHQVAFPAWRWEHKQAEVVVPLLKRIANEKLILVSSGG